MGIDDISGKVSAFWVRAKSALSGSPSDAASASQPSPRTPGDSVDLPNKGQYFAGYAFPEPADPAVGESGAPPETANPQEAKVWAPLVIAPFDTPPEPR